ncbi:MAG: hypothetical protein ABIO99_07625 [Candidatus Limnocylindria bacterium]
MFSRRVTLAVAGSIMLTVGLAGPVSAAKPSKPPASDPPSERPLTAEELAAADRKVAESDAYIASIRASGADLVTLGCPSPTGSGPQAQVPAATCTVPQGYLAVEARDQIKGTYCGPATGQVIANYSWAMRPGADKFTQAAIAVWMQTDRFGLTNAPELEDGLEVATNRSPRRPVGWDWVVFDLRDRDADGSTADELQGYVRSNVSGSKMPLAIPVKPHDPISRYYLVSWPKAVKSPGHWIAAYGWYGNYTGTTFARVYYTDSSRDEGGSTGKFWDPTRDIAALIGEHTRRIVW